MGWPLQAVLAAQVRTTAQAHGLSADPLYPGQNIVLYVLRNNTQYLQQVLLAFNQFPRTIAHVVSPTVRTFRLQICGGTCVSLHLLSNYSTPSALSGSLPQHRPVICMRMESTVPPAGANHCTMTSAYCIVCLRLTTACNAAQTALVNSGWDLSFWYLHQLGRWGTHPFVTHWAGCKLCARAEKFKPDATLANGTVLSHRTRCMAIYDVYIAHVAAQVSVTLHLTRHCTIGPTLSRRQTHRSALCSPVM